MPLDRIPPSTPNWVTEVVSKIIYLTEDVERQKLVKAPRLLLFLCGKREAGKSSLAAVVI